VCGWVGGVVWCWELGVELGVGREEHKWSDGCGEGRGDRGGFFVGGRLVGPGKGSGEWGVCGRGESWEWECVWRSHAGALGPERGVWPHRPRQRTRGLLWSGVDGGEVGELGRAENFFCGADSNRVWGGRRRTKKGHFMCWAGQERERLCVVCGGTRGGEGVERVGGCVADLRSEDFFGIGERVGVGKLCVWSGGVE